MRKLLFSASCAASMLLTFSQFAVAQGLTTDFETHPLIDKTNSAQPQGSTDSESRKGPGSDSGQAHSNEGFAARGGAGADQGVDAKPEGSVYPGADTTINGLPVYVSAAIKIGDRVQTGDTIGNLTVRTVSLVLGLNTTVVIQEVLFLKCGVVFVRSGTIAINDGKDTFSFTTGQTAYAASASCEDALPDSPGSVRTQEHRRSAKSRPDSSVTATGGWLVDARGVDWSFATVNGVMFGSSVAAAELTQRCLQARACNFVPGAFHSRAAMYGVGLPAAAGVSYLSYYLKRKGYRWWFVPAAVVIGGNIIVSEHAAHYDH